MQSIEFIDITQDGLFYCEIGKKSVATGLNGFIETLDESIKYPVITDKDGQGREGEVIIAGPTCDSADILYEDEKYKLPVDLKSGDKLYWLTTGAYTSTYASVAFNGFPPIKTYFITDEGVMDQDGNPAVPNA